MSHFKEAYTPEELKEIVDWFEERMDRLPAKLELDEATKTGDLRLTVERLTTILKRKKLDISFSGYVSHLFVIRDKLLESGFN